MKTELRYYSGLEVRQNSESRTIIGYALKFNTLSQNLGGFYESIHPRALDGADLSDVCAFLNHDQNCILARTPTTLKLGIDKTGLRYEFQAPNTSAGNDLIESLKRGDITGSSFAFIISEGGDSWEQKDEITIRTILSFKKIIDVSPVVFPAYKDTEVYKRAQESIEFEVRKQNINYNPKNKNEIPMNKKFSILSAIRQNIEGKYSDEMRDVIKRGEEIARKSGIKTSGGMAIPTESRTLDTSGGHTISQGVFFDFADPFREILVLAKAGATYIPNLIYNMTLPRGNGVKVKWAGENEAAEDGSNTFERIPFTPKRLTAYVNISRQLLLQTDDQAEQLVRNDIIQAIASKLETTCFSKDPENELIPNGFFTGVADEFLAISGAISRDKIIDMEALIGESNAPRTTRAYIVNEAGNKILKKTPKTAGSSNFLLENGIMNDAPVFVTNSIPSGLTATSQHGIVYGNFSDYLIAQWGIFDFIIDPFSKSESGVVVLTVNAYFDIKPRNKAAFAVGAFTMPA